MTAPRPRMPLATKAVLIGLLLLWMGGLAYLRLGGGKPPSTGDALLDAYLEHADEYGVIRSEKLAKLEPQFGGDPRYWEIVTTDIGPDFNYKEIDKIEDSAYTQYYELMRKGERPYSLYLHDRYVATRNNLWENEYRISPPPRDRNAPRPSMEERRAQNTKFDRATSTNIDKHHAAERTQLFVELTEKAPDAAQVWYRKAHLHYERNQFAEAIECIRKGNAAPDNSRLLPFPLKDYVQAINGDGPLAGHPRCQRLSHQLIASATPNFIEAKRLHFALWHEAVQRNDRATMNDLHRYACRAAMMDLRDIISGLTSNTLLKYEANQSLKLPGLTASQRSNLGTLIVRIDKVRGELRAMSSTSPSNQFLSGNPAGGGLMGMLRGQSTEVTSRIMHEDYIWTRREYDKRIMPELEAIASFDFVTMSFQP